MQIERKIYDARGNGNGGVSPTITGDHQNRITDYTVLVIESAYIQPSFAAWKETNVADTLRCSGVDLGGGGTETLILENQIGFCSSDYGGFRKTDSAMITTKTRLGGGETVILCNQQFWTGEQNCPTLTANNADGSQRMPDKDNFNCIIGERNEGG